MRTQRGLTYGLALTGLLGLGFLGWTHSNPAKAQNDAPPPGQRRPGPMGGMTSLAASGDYVYVLRGNTLYQMKAADLSMVTQKELPMPAGGVGAAAPAGAPGSP